LNWCRKLSTRSRMNIIFFNRLNWFFPRKGLNIQNHIQVAIINYVRAHLEMSLEANERGIVYDLPCSHAQWLSNTACCEGGCFNRSLNYCLFFCTLDQDLTCSPLPLLVSIAKKGTRIRLYLIISLNNHINQTIGWRDPTYRSIVVEKWSLAVARESSYRYIRKSPQCYISVERR